MNDKPISLIQPPQGYADWWSELKSRIYRVQLPDFKLLEAKLHQSINRAKQRLLNKGEL